MENVVVRALMPLVIGAGNQLPRHSRYVIPVIRSLNRFESRVRRQYISKQFNFSIGIYTGEDLTTIRPHPGANNPVLRREDIHDVDAELVADPFMIKDDRWYMFFEVLNRERNLGEIALATSDDGLKWDYQRVVLREPHHLSYPYVFRHEGRFLMIPESREEGLINLYEADRLDGEWTKKKILLKSNGADASVVFHQGRWWMFIDSSDTAEHDRLRLFYSDSIEGEWIEHLQSPIIDRNPCFARPAGRIVNINGRLIRFGQDSVPEYGTRVWAFEIIKLTPHDYDEQRLLPTPILAPVRKGWNENGMHHIDAHQLEDGSILACVDGR